MERLERRLPRSTKIAKTFFLLFTLLLYGCSIKKMNFATVYGAYKWLGEDRQNERKSKIMNLFHEYKAKSVISGVEDISNPKFTETYHYIAFCNEADFRKLNFIPLGNKHRGIAYITQFAVYSNGLYNFIEDSLKIYFPNSLQARNWVEESLKYGFEYVDYNSYSFEETYIDSISKVKASCATYYYDSDYNAAYSIRVLSEKDNNVVILHFSQ